LPSVKKTTITVWRIMGIIPGQYTSIVEHYMPHKPNTDDIVTILLELMNKGIVPQKIAIRPVKIEVEILDDT